MKLSYSNFQTKLIYKRVYVKKSKRIFFGSNDKIIAILFSSQKYRRQTHPRYHPTISPGPRSVDFIKYPFTESSSEDNFKIDDNVTKRTSFRGSRSPTSTPRQPYNIKQKVPDNAGLICCA